MKNTHKFIILAGISVFALAGCSGVKKDLGLTRSSPDEFTVVHRAPLSMPPDYTLRPPEPGTPRPQDAVVEEQARTAVFGNDDAASDAHITSSDDAFLKDTGADQASDSIRQAVDRETAALPPKSKPVTQRLLGWTHSDKPQEPAATVVDAEKEAARLHNNQVQGKSPTDGETPTKQE